MIHYFERKLKFTDLEIWDIHIESTIYRMVLSDENRPSVQSDFNLSPTDELFDQRANIIIGSIYSNHPVQPEHIESLDQFMKQVTDHVALAHCDVVLNFYTKDIEMVFTQLVKEKTGRNCDQLLVEQLWHLTQDKE